MNVKEKALKKCKELAIKYNNKEVEKYGDYGYVFVLDEDLLGKFIAEEKLDIYGYSKEYDYIDASAVYEPAGEYGSVFVNRGGFQEEDRLLAGVSYNQL